MLNYSDLTVVNNSDGLPTALGYSINSSFINNKTPLFISTGGGKKQTSLKNKKQKKDKNKNNNTEYSEYVQDNDSHADYDSLAVPAGLVCVTETTCRTPNEMYKNIKNQNAAMIEASRKKDSPMFNLEPVRFLLN